MNWQFVSFLGDSTVLLPSAAALFIVLLLRRASLRLAWYWALLFGITGAVVCASKLAFMGWGLGIRELDFTGFSGHTALAFAFWPVFLARIIPSVPRSAALAGYVLAALVGYSRLVIHAHSESEVITGSILGICASVLFLVLQTRQCYAANVRLSWSGIVCLVIIPTMLLNTGIKAPTQSLLGEIAVMLGPLEKPFTRSNLHQLRVY